MPKSLIALFIAIFCFTSMAGEYEVKAGDSLGKIAKKYSTTVEELKKINPQIKNINLIKIGEVVNVPDLDKDKCFEAFVEVESGGNDSAIGDGGKAVGCIQMWPIMVDEVNRIGKTNYTYNDRYDRNKCKEMFLIIIDKKHVNTIEEMVKIWNPKYKGSKYNDAYERLLTK